MCRAAMTSANLDRSLIPPDELRFRVANSLDPGEFLGVGERCANDLRTAISSLGRNVAECKEVLDFGCGSGRTLRWFTESPPRFYGSDMDAEAIGWCENHLAGMTFVVNQALPPLPFCSDKFDFVYAISVFSHLDETHAMIWLQELQRVAAPNAILAISICGPLIYQASARDVVELHEKGLVFSQPGYWKNHFPDWYGDMYYDEAGARRLFGRNLDFLALLPAGINGHQDLVLLRKP
jgi:SAM-dependent methyltransferase